MAYTLAIITGILIIIIDLFVFIFRSRGISLLLKLSADACGSLNALFIYFATNNPIMLASMATCAIAVIRDLLFYFRGRVKALECLAWPIGISILASSTLIWTYAGPISLLPAIGSVISTMTLYLVNVKLMKIGAIISTSLYIVYYALLVGDSGLLTLFSLIASSTLVIGSIIGLIILFIKGEDKNSQEGTEEANS